MADEVTNILENMRLTIEEEETIEIPDEGRKEGVENCALSLIGKFLTCRPFNKQATITTLKRAWGLEETVQIVEVGTNLFQLKFQSEFEMNRVLKGGPWTFDNQVLLLIQWKIGMMADNVKFDSVSLWIQIWGAPFHLVSPKVAKAMGNKLGSVVEVEKKQKLEGQSYFMRVKVAISLAKPIRRGAFLASSEGTKNWVTLKYERLPLFCHYCGILGHDLKHCTSYYAATKNDGETRCQYEDWLKATSGRNRSLARRNATRDEVGGAAHREENRTAQTSPVAEATDGKAKVPSPKEQDALCKEMHNGNQGTGGDLFDVASEINELGATNNEGLNADVIDNIDMGLFSNAECGIEGADPMQLVSMEVRNGPQSPKTKATWTRVRHKEIGPQEFNREEAKSVLGKRSTNREGSSQVEDEHGEVVKRGKSSVKSNSEESAGVLMHPCRSQ